MRLRRRCENTKNPVPRSGTGHKPAVPPRLSLINRLHLEDPITGVGRNAYFALGLSAPAPQALGILRHRQDVFQPVNVPLCRRVGPLEPPASSHFSRGAPSVRTKGDAPLVLNGIMGAFPPSVKPSGQKIISPREKTASPPPVFICAKGQQIGRGVSTGPIGQPWSTPIPPLDLKKLPPLAHKWI